jgi:hypothetical protein
MLKRACGQYYSVDKFRAQRQEKFQMTRCPECAARVVEERQGLIGATGVLILGGLSVIVCILWLAIAVIYRPFQVTVRPKPM